MKTTLMIATFALLFSNLALAGVTSSRADVRQHNQAHRITDRVENGSLTRRETGRLVRQQANIHRAERRFESDGRLTDGERARLEVKQDRASRNIYRKKHNARSRT